LFPGRELGRAERALFSAGTSIAVTALGSVALDRTVWGLQAGSWMMLLLGITLVAGLAALLRRQRAVMREEGAAPARLGFSPAQGLALGLAALGAAAAFGLASMPAPPQNGQGYTLLWILPAADGSPEAVRLGLASGEFTTTEYRLEVRVNHEPASEWTGLRLAPGESWEGTAEVPAPQAERFVEARLYRLDEPASVYRRVTLWIDAEEG
jgi:uncharacterized membrane protein